MPQVAGSEQPACSKLACGLAQSRLQRAVSGVGLRHAGVARPERNPRSRTICVGRVEPQAKPDVPRAAYIAAISGGLTDRRRTSGCALRA
jgi:hypothetical protein